MNRMNHEMVPLELVKFNPLNPRKNYKQDVEQMKNVLQERGWETAITCYQKKGEYIILSGHRRRYAAEELKMKEIPVFVVPAPESELEELERLASAQGGQVDWNPYEWARYTFNLWNLKGGPQGNCSYKELALKLGVSERLIYKRLHVFRFYDHRKIENQLIEGTLSISILSEAAHWISKLEAKHPDIVKELTLEGIKTAMIIKSEYKVFSSVELRVDRFLDVAPKEIITKFLKEHKLSLKKAYELATGEPLSTAKSGGSYLRQTVNNLEKRYEELMQIDAENPKHAQELYELLEKLEKTLENKLDEVSQVANK